MVRTRKMAKEEGESAEETFKDLNLTVILGRRGRRKKVQKRDEDLRRLSARGSTNPEAVEELGQDQDQTQDEKQRQSQPFQSPLKERKVRRGRKRKWPDACGVDKGTQTEGPEPVPVLHTATVGTMTETDAEMTEEITSQTRMQMQKQSLQADSNCKTGEPNLEKLDQDAPIWNSETDKDATPKVFREERTATRKVLFHGQDSDSADAKYHEHEHEEKELNETPKELGYDVTPYSFLEARPEEDENNYEYRDGKFIPDWTKRQNLTRALILQIDGCLNLFPLSDREPEKCYPDARSPAISDSDSDDSELESDSVGSEDTKKLRAFGLVKEDENEVQEKIVDNEIQQTVVTEIDQTAVKTEIDDNGKEPVEIEIHRKDGENEQVEDRIQQQKETEMQHGKIPVAVPQVQDTNAYAYLNLFPSQDIDSLCFPEEISPVIPDRSRQEPSRSEQKDESNQDGSTEVMVKIVGHQTSTPARETRDRDEQWCCWYY